MFTPAEHDVGEHQDRQVEQVSQRQAEMEGLLEEIGADREEHGEGNAANREDARVRKVWEEKHDGPANEPDAHEGEHESRHELTGCVAENAADNKDDRRNECGNAEHENIAGLEGLLCEEPGEGEGDRIFGLPHEEIEQEPSDHDDADGDGEELRAGLKREPGHAVHRLQAQQQAEQRKGDNAGEQGIDEGRLEPLAERCAGLDQGAQTFSTSGRPSRPVGKKMSTIASMEKAATSLYSMLK
jgi:hypothetical protein